VSRRLERLLADEDAVDGGGHLQAGGRVDDIAHGHRRPFRCEGVKRDKRFAGRDGDPHPLRPALLGEPIPDGERRADRSLGVVLVGDRGAKQRHDGVADEFLDPAAEALELGPNVRIVRREEGEDVLGVELLGGRRAIDKVGEEDGDDLPLLPRLSGAGSRTTLAGEDGIVVEHPPVEVPQPLGRLDSELVDERSPRLTVRREGLRRPPGAVEGEHELGAQALAEGMLRDQHFELGNQLAGSPEGEVGLETVLQRRETKLVQSRDLRRDGVLVEDVGEGQPPPEGKPASKHLGRPGGLVREHGARGACEALEARCIELVEIDSERVAGRTRLHHPARGILSSAGLENPPQLRDVEPELAAGLRRVFGPEHVDDPVRRQDLVRVHQE
jgi:hypothetical protein